MILPVRLQTPASPNGSAASAREPHTESLDVFVTSLTCHTVHRAHQAHAVTEHVKFADDVTKHSSAQTVAEDHRFYTFARVNGLVSIPRPAMV
jgi:hypothetical protein